MAEGARLESVFTRKGNVGSNPTLSASFPKNQHVYCIFIDLNCLGVYNGVHRERHRHHEKQDSQLF